MSTLRIGFREGKFASHNGVNVKKATENHIEGNDWVGDVDGDGNIIFSAVRYYAGVRHQLSVRIKDGVFTKSLKIGKNKPVMLKAYKISDWPVDGVIGLSNGDISERVTYFREASFQKFLDEHNLTAVRHEAANDTYKLVHVRIGNDYTSKEALETDGKVRIISNEAEFSKGGEPYAVIQTVEITDASWVIKSVWKFGQLRHRILYTLDEVQKIVGLPKE